MNQRWDSEGQAAAALSLAVRDYGAQVLGSAEVFGNLLKDLLPDLPREAGLLIAAAQCGVAESLVQRIGEQRMDPGAAVRLAAASIEARNAVNTDAALWAASAMARTLGYQVDEDVVPPAGMGATTTQDVPPTVVADLGRIGQLPLDKTRSYGEPESAGPGGPFVIMPPPPAQQPPRARASARRAALGAGAGAAVLVVVTAFALHGGGGSAPIGMRTTTTDPATAPSTYPTPTPPTSTTPDPSPTDPDTSPTDPDTSPSDGDTLPRGLSSSEQDLWHRLSGAELDLGACESFSSKMTSADAAIECPTAGLSQMVAVGQYSGASSVEAAVADRGSAEATSGKCADDVGGNHLSSWNNPSDKRMGALKCAWLDSGTYDIASAFDAAGVLVVVEDADAATAFKWWKSHINSVLASQPSGGITDY